MSKQTSTPTVNIKASHSSLQIIITGQYKYIEILIRGKNITLHSLIIKNRFTGCN